jgi:putative ABC transport system ATP-binding protein
VSIIEVTNLYKSVDSGHAHIKILEAVNFKIEMGESVAIVGASGSGKSTLLGLLAGLDSPTSGEIKLKGNNIDALNEDQRAQVRADHVGFVFQNFYLVPGLSVLENVMLPLEITSNKDAEQKAREYIEKVGLTDRIEHLPSQLSGGEQQRVALARAFVAEPDILFADEPTGNLDQHTGNSIVDLLFALNQDSNTTLILVTHDNSLAERCMRKLVLDEAGLKEVAVKTATAHD